MLPMCLIGRSRSKWVQRLYSKYRKTYELFPIKRCSHNKSQKIAKDAEEVELKRILVTIKSRSHMVASLDPLKNSFRSDAALSDAMEGLKKINIGASLVEPIRSTYQGYVGYEFGHIETLEETSWLESRIEEMAKIQPSQEEKERIARLLIESEVFDNFMAKRFGQVKRYGLEGCESMLVALDAVFRGCLAEHAVIGMPHRGRLNLMVGLLGYPTEAIFYKLKGNSELSDTRLSADVLSHLSHSGKARDNEALRVTLLPNSSHLETVNSATQGFAYALGNLKGPKSQTVLPIQIHGDAAFAGQGVVMETLQMLKLPGFSVGGSLHITVNNQLGFTTPCELGRSTCYSTDLAKMIQAPVFHVNADHPEVLSLKIWGLLSKYDIHY